jgi:hypothetical protein
MWNGNPTFRIWIVGTHRILGVNPPPSDLDASGLPAEVENLLGGRWDKSLFGNFLVCPVSHYQQGVMLYVFVTRATDLALRPRPPVTAQ